MVKSTYCCKGPGFYSQHPHGSLQSPVTLVPWSIMSSSDLQGHQAHEVYRHIFGQNAHVHKSKFIGERDLTSVNPVSAFRLTCQYICFIETQVQLFTLSQTGPEVLFHDVGTSSFTLRVHDQSRSSMDGAHAVAFVTSHIFLRIA